MGVSLNLHETRVPPRKVGKLENRDPKVGRGRGIRHAALRGGSATPLCAGKKCEILVPLGRPGAAVFRGIRALKTEIPR